MMTRWKSLLSIGLLSCCTTLLAENGVAENTVGIKAEESIKQHKPVQARIIGGTESEKDAWPFMTALVKKSQSASRGQFCGASYIGGRYILTAAHCIDNSSADQLDVVIGIHNLTNENAEGQRIAVTHIFAHESYNDSISLDNDIAILELATEPTGITPIKTMTPQLMSQLKVGDSLTVMGWGNRSTTNEGDFPNILHQVDVALFDQAECESAYGNGISETMLCAGFIEGGKDSCQGDSGGPLVVEIDNEWYQLGVVSWGRGCAQANFPGVYARVSFFEQWLVQKISNIKLNSLDELVYAGVGKQIEHTFSFANGSDTTLNMGSAIVNELINLAQPTIIDDSCTGQTIAPQNTCNVTVLFTAENMGDIGFQLSIGTNHPLVPNVSAQLNLKVLPETNFDPNPVLGIIGLEWFTNSINGWKIATETSDNDETVLQSAGIDDLESSTLMTNIQGPRKLSFDYRVSSELNYDFLVVTLNGEPQLVESGEMSEFELIEVDLVEGNNQITFTYQKDQSESSFDDAAYINNLAIENDNPQIILSNSTIDVNASETVTLNASNSLDPNGDKLTFQWSQLSGSSISFNSSTSEIASFVAPNTSDKLVLKLMLTDQYGGMSESEVIINVTASDSDDSTGGSFPIILLLMLSLSGFFRKK